LKRLFFEGIFLQEEKGKNSINELNWLWILHFYIGAISFTLSAGEASFFPLRVFAISRFRD
jgi:hypothetical protein